MSDQAPNRQLSRWTAIRLRADAALRLGPRPVGLWLADRALRPLARRWLGDAPMAEGPFLPPIAPPAPGLPDGPPPPPGTGDWHGGHDPAAHALDLDLAGARPLWEAHRLGALPLLAMAARRDPGGGHLARAEALLADWCRANPPFRGIGWACGQEAALRALHLALALALLEADRDPPPGARALLRLSARRIAATPLYALAQDNNHPISEAAGAFACALLLGGEVARPARALAARVARLVAPDGGFAQVSPGYARLALDVLAVAEWLRRRHGAPAFPAPLGDRAAALAAWLHRLTDPATGAIPPLGLEDGSAFADLSGCGPRDARGSVERAARLFAARGADAPGDAGCAWLGLAAPPGRLDRPARWQAAGTRGWQAGDDLALLRTGPLRFRPGQADLLHLSLRLGPAWVVRDGGTGSYDPPEPWWWDALAGAAAHNAPVFDAAEPMPRVGRFLLARWPRLEGTTLRDSRGNRVTREVTRDGDGWAVRDRLAGAFRRVAWHWRLAEGAWRLAGDRLEGPAVLEFRADAPLRLELGHGWASPAYGAIAPAPMLRVAAAAPIGWMAMRVRAA